LRRVRSKIRIAPDLTREGNRVFYIRVPHDAATPNVSGLSAFERVAGPYSTERLREVDSENLDTVRQLFAPDAGTRSIVVFVAHRAWQPNTRTVRHKRLNQWIAESGIGRENLDGYREDSIESADGIRFCATWAHPVERFEQFGPLSRVGLGVIALIVNPDAVESLQPRALFDACYRDTAGAYGTDLSMASIVEFAVSQGAALVRVSDWTHDNEVSAEVVFPSRWLPLVRMRAESIGVEVEVR